jgi:Fe-S-cluster-containing hydrogenase component 2
VSEPPLTVLRCIGCGAVETPQPCLGACVDRAVELVESSAITAAATELAAATTAIAAAERVARRLAAGLPPDGDSAIAYEALRREARAVVRAGPRPVPLPSVERVAAWACDTCGRVEAPQQCLGVCVRHPVDMRDAAELDALLSRAAAARERAGRILALVRRVAAVTPRPGGHAATYRALAEEARTVLR